jgi:signal transduction histidine kinase
MEAPPVPVNLDAGLSSSLGGARLWSTVEGQVTFAAARAQGALLELRSRSGRPVHIEVLGSFELPLELLVNGQVRASGVAMEVMTPAEQRSLAVATLAGSKAVQIVDLAPEAWAAYPVSPVTAAVADPNNGPRAVRLTGWLRRDRADSDARFSLCEGEARIALERDWGCLDLVDTWVEAVGVLRHSSTGFTLGNHCLRPAPVPRQDTPLTLLTSADQVRRLDRGEALRRHPVRLRGVVTSVLPGDCRNFVIQDASHGIFIYATNPPAGQCPRLGEFWQVEGVSGAGGFSPFVLAGGLELLGPGQMPEPVRPTWDQMVNGSLDNQYVEIEGVITKTAPKSLELLTHWGKITITIFGRDMKELAPYENRLVRLRGCLKAQWDGVTHQLKFGAIRLDDAILGVHHVVPGDPFSVPLKSASQLKLFDHQAGVFRRVHVAGQIVGHSGHEFFLMDGATGLRFISGDTNGLRAGDRVQVVGYPDLGGHSPLLHDTFSRRVGHAPLPAPKRLSAENLLHAENDSVRVEIDGMLANLQVGQRETVLEMRNEFHPFVARLPAAPGGWEPGSHLRLTGVYAGQGLTSLEGDRLAGFEILLNSSLDVEVLARPPLWTFRLLLLAMAVLTAVLLVAGLWIILLRRQVDRRTAQLELANRQREETERARVLDEERLRIAQDLHDDLGSSLTEITMLGSMGLSESKDTRSDYISQMVKKARASVNALDAIVWAVNPCENTVQSLSDYLAAFADEFLNASGIACRIRMPVSFPAITLDGRTRHELFLAAKEALNNAVRHGQPSEVELGVAIEELGLTMTVTDNGVGFEPTGGKLNHGLGNMRDRLEKLGGRCQIDSALGRGTVVTLLLPLPRALADTAFAV